MLNLSSYVISDKTSITRLPLGQARCARTLLVVAASFNPKRRSFVLVTDQEIKRSLISRR